MIRFLGLLLLLALSPPARAATVVKLATLAPEGSTWANALAEMGQEWSRITGGEVEVRIYPGGVAGNETVMMRKMRIGQLHAAAVTVLGLTDIDPGPQVTNTPLLIRSYDELDAVMAELAPEFERRLEAGGFKVLNWSDAGWVHLFTREPMVDPATRGRFKFFAWEGDPAAVRAYRAAGFTPVVVAATDVLPALRSGLLDAFPATPLSALALQWFALAPHMLDLPWNPLVGATIMTMDAWNALPAEHRPALLAAAREAGRRIQAEVRRQDARAVEVMKRYGLQVHPVPPEFRPGWEQAALAAWPVIRGEMVPVEVFVRNRGDGTFAEATRAATE